MSIAVYWLIGGAALLALEAFGLPGIGFMFAGLAALVVGLGLELGLLAADALVAQWAVFFLATALMAVLLWKKLISWRLNPNGPQYSNIIGTEAVVTKTLVGDQEGEVRWSGTLMRARQLTAGNPDIVVSSIVVIRQVEGNVLYVVPKL